MTSTDLLCGYDALFVSEVPEYLRCVVCQLVLRNPRQILTCGHKFCDQCFERYKCHSKNMNSELYCPVDRTKIDLTYVCVDKAMERVIGNLMVKCSNNGNGCEWTGALIDVVIHQDKCEYRGLMDLPDIPSFHTDKSSPLLLSEIYQKMNKFEEALLEKEKDIAFLKFNLQEVKIRFDESLVDVSVLKEQKQVMESELNLVKIQNRDLKYVELKVENLLLKNVALEQKVSTLENQLLGPKELVEDKTDLIAVKREIKDIRALVEEYKTASTVSSVHSKELHSTITNEMNEMRSPFKKSMNEQSDHTKQSSSQITERKGNDHVLDDNRNPIPAVQEKVKDLESHVKNIENILFCHFLSRPKEIVLQWTIQNFQQHFNIGEMVLSPVFFTEIEGYSFQLKVEWSVEQKGTMGIYLWLHRGKDTDQELKPFRIPFTIELQVKEETIESGEVTLEDLEEERENCFSILPGLVANFDYGFGDFISMSELQNFIVNDTISIRCRFRLSYTN